MHRFIPAWAGNTCRPRFEACHIAVHPRVGGEHLPNRHGSARNSGSSPRGRGTRVHRRSVRPDRRFIPAWAGNTRLLCMRFEMTPVHPRVGGEHERIGRNSWCHAVHPRVGGEHNPRRCHVYTRDGSSPRGRGTQPHGNSFERDTRFIPAWAGNTLEKNDGSRVPSVHPRVGGEHIVERTAGVDRYGSSPRGRGTHGGDEVDDIQVSVHPAWAGNTPCSCANPMRRTVHPRVGGEHLPPSAIVPEDVGSSPRGRGTLRHRKGVTTMQRFIPAWAGNTESNGTVMQAYAVHPRVGGEHTSDALQSAFLAGSSPRGRGTRRSLR